MTEQQRARLDSEWLGLNAIREALSVGTRGAQATYATALAVGWRAAPELFDPHHSLMARGQEPPLVREFRESAEAETQRSGREVLPVQLLDAEIARVEELVGAPGAPRKQLRNKLRGLRAARELLFKSRFTENQLLNRDYFTARRPELPVPPHFGPNYVEYSLPFDQALRLRLFHPDKPEHKTGADLLYEFCDDDRRLVRLAFVQYKLWDGKSHGFLHSSRLEAQLSRLREVCCTGRLCVACPSECEMVDDEVRPRAAEYRFPFCAAFLRPTDRLQRPGADLISSGLHIPVCSLTRDVSLDAMGGRARKSVPLQRHAVSEQVFEELFNRDLLGSRWMPYEEVEELYRSSGIFEPHEHLFVHAQQFKVRVASSRARRGKRP